MAKKGNKARAACPQYCCQVVAMRPTVALQAPSRRARLVVSPLPPKHLHNTHSHWLRLVTDRMVCLPRSAELDPQLFQNSQ